jgi:hypothetical protein
VEWSQGEGLEEMEWSQGEGLEENKACNLAVQESRAMGLEVLDTALFVKKKSQSDGTNRNDAMDSAEDKNQSKAFPVPGSCNDEKAKHAPIISGSKTSDNAAWDHSPPAQPKQ